MSRPSGAVTQEDVAALQRELRVARATAGEMMGKLGQELLATVAEERSLLALLDRVHSQLLNASPGYAATALGQEVAAALAIGKSRHG